MARVTPFAVSAADTALTKLTAAVFAAADAAPVPTTSAFAANPGR
jgi:hypothetical protein